MDSTKLRCCKAISDFPMGEATARIVVVSDCESSLPNV